MEKGENARLHALVEGNVQGVGFRYFVQGHAAELNLTGCVRNRWTGNVEDQAEGGRPDLEKLLELLYRGPRSAVVTGVTAEWLPFTGEHSGFRIRLTAS